MEPRKTYFYTSYFLRSPLSARHLCSGLLLDHYFSMYIKALSTPFFFVLLSSWGVELKEVLTLSALISEFRQINTLRNLLLPLESPKRWTQLIHTCELRPNIWQTRRRRHKQVLHPPSLSYASMRHSDQSQRPTSLLEANVATYHG